MAFQMKAPKETDAQTWLRYANQGATRNQNISPKLQEALSFLPDLGVSMEVFSGGQDAKGPNRVGSTRHDHGDAADAFFYKGDEKLDWSNPDHLPIFEQIVSKARNNGITGIGAGEGYMRPGSMHIGFGNQAVWGADGKSENAPGWLRAAFGSGHHLGDGHDHGVPSKDQSNQSRDTVSENAFKAAFARLGRGASEDEKEFKTAAQDRLAGVGASLMSIDQGGNPLAPILDRAGKMPAFKFPKGFF